MKGVRVRFVVLPASGNKAYTQMLHDYERHIYNGSIDEVYKAFLHQHDKIMRNITREYEHKISIYSDVGYINLARVSDLRVLAIKDLETDLQAMHFTINYTMREVTAPFISLDYCIIEGVSISEKIEDPDEFELPKRKGEYYDGNEVVLVNDIFGNINIDIPRWYSEHLGDIQGIMEL